MVLVLEELALVDHAGLGLVLSAVTRLVHVRLVLLVHVSAVFFAKSSFFVVVVLVVRVLHMMNIVMKMFVFNMMSLGKNNEN